MAVRQGNAIALLHAFAGGRLFGFEAKRSGTVASPRDSGSMAKALDWGAKTQVIRCGI